MGGFGREAGSFGGRGFDNVVNVRRRFRHEPVRHLLFKNRQADVFFLVPFGLPSQLDEFVDTKPSLMISVTELCR